MYEGCRILREEHSLRVSDYKVPGILFGLLREAVNERIEKLTY